MGDKINWLVTVVYRGRLLRCALQLPKATLAPGFLAYPMEPKNRRKIRSLLPKHVQSCGPVVDVEEIFEIHVVEE